MTVRGCTCAQFQLAAQSKAQNTSYMTKNTSHSCKTRCITQRTAVPLRQLCPQHRRNMTMNSGCMSAASAIAARCQAAKVGRQSGTATGSIVRLGLAAAKQSNPKLSRSPAASVCVHSCHKQKQDAPSNIQLFECILLPLSLNKDTAGRHLVTHKCDKCVAGGCSIFQREPPQNPAGMNRQPNSHESCWQTCDVCGSMLHSSSSSSAHVHIRGSSRAIEGQWVQEQQRKWAV